jgi:cell division protein FtsB
MANIKPIITKVLTTLGAIALLASLGFSGVTYLSKRSLETQNKAQTDRLASLDHEVERLRQHDSDDAAKVKDDAAKLKALQDQLARLLAENGGLKDNMGAFAEQAGACEKIRHTLKLGA